jgi:hypothetical protein
MPLQKLELRPGINKEFTNYANEGGFYSCDKVRFRSGYAEKIGGWINQTSSGSTFKGVCRSLWNWATILSENLLGVGTNQKFYVEAGGIYHDITPVRDTVTLGVDPFTTTAGSKLVVVTALTHGVAIGTFITISGATAVGGLTLNGEFEVVEIPTSNSFSIVVSTAAASGATGGGASVVVQYDINSGNAVYTTGLGWGGPPWGSGGWGSGTAVGIPLRLWTQVNYGDDLLLAPRSDPIYYWTKDTTTFARAILLSEKADSVPKITTTATFGSGTTTITVTNATGITSGCVVSGIGIPTGAFVTTAYAGGLTVPISIATTSASSGSYTFSYAGRHTPNETNQITASSTNDFIIAMGSNPYDPFDFQTDFDPLLVRWSDQGNPFEWVPEITNQAGENRLSNGSYIVTSLNTRQEILIWTDAALISMQYLGPPFVWGFTLLMDNLSIASSNAAITVNNVTYWMGTDKFYMYSGRVETLPCSLRQFVFQNINKDQIAQVVCGSNEGYNEVWWFYPSGNSTVNDSYVVFNHLENTWYYGTINRTAWLDSPLKQYPLGAFSIQGSYLDGNIDSSQTSLSLLNGFSYPSSGVVQIDSEKIYYGNRSGNTLLDCIRGFDNTTPASHTEDTAVPYMAINQVMYHEFGVDDQSTGVPAPIEAYVETSDFDIGDGQHFGYVWRMLPDLTFSGSTVSNPKVTMTIKPRQNSGSPYTPADAPEVVRTSTVPIEQFTGQVYTRVRGRQMAFRVDSVDLGVTWQLGAMRIDVRPDGRR